MSIQSIVTEVNALVTAFEPAITALSPTAGVSITVFEGIAKAALAGEASATALIAQVKAGTPLTAAQIAAQNVSADADLDTALAQLDSDIAAKSGS